MFSIYVLEYFFKCGPLCRGSKANVLLPFKCYQYYLAHKFIISKQITSIKGNVRGQCMSPNFYLYVFYA